MQRAEPLTGSWAVAEEIAAKDLNNLYLTSCWFVDTERYRAFCALYAVMRVVDDRIDAIPARRALEETDRTREHAVVDAWDRALRSAMAGAASAEEVAACDHPQTAPLLEVAGEAMRRFPVPWELWRNFFAAMHQDIDRPRFATYAEFLDYTEGASVAPTTIYLYLIVASPDGEGVYRLPEGFDLLTCGRHLGTFAYLGHIVRDLAADLATGDEGLLYLATEDLTQHGLDETTLRHDLAAKSAGEPLRALVRTLLDRSRQECTRGRALLAPVDGTLSPDRAFVLELIVTIYERVLAKIVDTGHDPMAERHRLTFDEKQAISRQVAERVGFSGLE